MLKVLLGVVSHGVMLGAGVAIGIFILPILIAPPPPSDAALSQAASAASYSADIPEDLAGYDLLHWGEGRFSVSDTQIVHQGSLAPGPDYRLYLTDTFVEDEAGFLPLKDSAQRIGSVRSFDGFVLPVPKGISVDDHSVIVIWCETFGEFITAAAYK